MERTLATNARVRMMSSNNTPRQVGSHAWRRRKEPNSALSLSRWIGLSPCFGSHETAFPGGFTGGLFASNQ